MPTAAELLRQGRNDELWQMGCGFVSLTTEQFMAIQKRLLLEQIDLLNRSAFGNKIMLGTNPDTIEDFREQVPLTTYADYCPELIEKREDLLPIKPAMWVHSSGKSGEYPAKWVPITPAYAQALGEVMCGLGILASCKEWGDISGLNEHPKFVYTVAPRPYMSGALASILQEQTSANYLPSLTEAENLPFEERIKLGLNQALSQGLDYFFGLSLVLAAIGDKFGQSSHKIDIRPFLSQPKALLRLTKGLTKSKFARRSMLPRDLWSVKGIISSGLDSMFYKDKIKELWGRYPLDVYAGTEGGIIATQTWDYDGMTFIPNLNFLEFIPEKEHWKWQLDHSYQPRTVLLDEVEADENYELVITNFHGGAMIRYRIGDMIKVTSLRNEKLGIDIPQMVFERRADDLIDFVYIRLSEKSIWQAIENTGIAYENWTARKKTGEPLLQLFVELKDGYQTSEANIATAVYQQILNSDNDSSTTSVAHENLTDMLNFKVETILLPHGSFANYTSQRQAEGADLAHLKPPHINPSDKVLSFLLATPEVAVEAKVEAEAVASR